ncbi:MAG: hypothetical protein HOW59_40420 [Nonomuraea sp.]|nr:hypothetical protein [Nonomuraea sp.]
MSVTLSEHTARDTRPLRRHALALLVPLGPLCVAALRTILPYGTDDGSAAVVAAVTAAPGQQTAVIWLGLLAVLAFVPSLLTLGRLAARRAPVLAAFAVVLAVPGYAGIATLTAVDAAVLASVDAGLSPADATRLLDSMNALPALATFTGLFVAGHILGTILLAVALWRGGLVPGWAALVLGVSQPLHLATVITGAPKLLDGGAWALTALGFALAAVTLARTPDDAYDLPPLPRS